MSNDLIIDSGESEVKIALLKDKKLVELHYEEKNKEFTVGDIYLGKVKRLSPGLNAAFVDVGHEKDAFLHYLDLGPHIKSFNKYLKRALAGKLPSSSLSGFSIDTPISKDGNISDVLDQGQYVLVQVAKEPISTKGPRITCEVTLAGRYLVLVPFSDRVSISQKIKSQEERDRLKRLMTSIKPKNFGVIVRTVAENKKAAELDKDLKDLVQRWRKNHKSLKGCTPPKRTLSEMNRSSAILRDVLNPSFENIIVNENELAESLKSYISSISPGREKIIKEFKKKEDIFEHFGIVKQIKHSFGKHVTMKSGAYLVIEHTEAMHVIDVNSGNTAKSKDDQETNALRVNLESAEEVARQLKLRDMGGIIVVDFIDLHKAENRKALYEKMKSAMADDKAKHTVLPPSKFGLVQITRQRVRPQMTIKTAEKCPTCNGTGEVQASILLIDEIESKLKAIIDDYKDSSITIAVHPFVEAYLKKGYPSTQMKWSISLRKRIKIKPVTSYSFLEYKFFNSKEEEIF